MYKWAIFTKERYCQEVYKNPLFGVQHNPAGLPYPHPRLWSSDGVLIMKMTFKCYISENDENILLFRHFLLVDNNQSLEMPWMMGGGGGNISCLFYLTPHPQLWSSDCVQIMKMTFKCYISENDENFLISRHFLLVYNNQSLKIPWMMGGWQPIPAGLPYPPPKIFEQ